MGNKQHHAKTYDQYRALLLQWLILIGHDWADYKRVRPAGLQFEVGRLERMGYLEYREQPAPSYRYEYRITDKGMKLIEKDIT